MVIDIGNDEIQQNELDKVIYDPSVVLSEKTGRGPLIEDWIPNSNPIMCAYKLADLKFQVFGFQTKVENMLFNYQKNIMTNFHKQVFCIIDEWHGFSMEDIRRIEDQIKQELELVSGRAQSEGPIVNMSVSESPVPSSLSAKSMP